MKSISVAVLPAREVKPPFVRNGNCWSEAPSTSL